MCRICGEKIETVTHLTGSCGLLMKGPGKVRPDKVGARVHLDLDIHINNNKFEYKLYDKRDSYEFFIVRFPYIKSNKYLRKYFIPA